MSTLSTRRHWLIAALLGVLVALLAHHWTIAKAPSFLMGRAVDRIAGDGELNAMSYPPLATDESRQIVRPSPDLAYAACAFDVSKGPVVVEALPANSPYWSLSVFDGQTDAVFVRNNRQTANRPVRIAILKPGTAAPAGFEPVPVGTDQGIALLRVLVPDRAGFPAIDAARRLSNCRSVAVQP